MKGRKRILRKGLSGKILSFTMALAMVANLMGGYCAATELSTKEVKAANAEQPPYRNVMYYGDWSIYSGQKNFWIIIVGGILLLIVLAVCAYLAYTKRPAEKTGKSFVYGFLEPILLFMVVIPAALAIGTMFALIGPEENRTGWWIFGLVLGTVVFYGILQVIFAMDFRKDLSTPFQAPYQPSVAHYTDNYILLISGSKAFSYAGQRIGVSCISDKLYHRSYPGLTKRYGGGTFGTVFIHRVLYALSSGTSHSAQFAMAAMLKAANEGKYNFLDEVKIYGERARKLKEIFLRHGFHLVYDKDLGEPIADGFYFTIGYPGMTSGELAKELMYYGVSAISLVTTGSHQQGLRACTSFIKDHQYVQLDERMKIFKENHPIS